MTPEFHPYGAAHFVVLFLTVSLPFLLAAAARNRPRADRTIAGVLTTLLLGNYAVFLAVVPRSLGLGWREFLPMQMCDWGMVVAIVVLWTHRPRWFEVAYFWGLGGTLQAVLTPNLNVGFPDFRFLSFFISHAGIIVAVGYLMLAHRLRPYPLSIVRVFLWSELYFVVTFLTDAITGVNYGFLLHKPEAFSLLSYLSDSRPLYLLQMHGLALAFFLVLYSPFALADLLRGKRLDDNPERAAPVCSRDR